MAAPEGGRRGRVHLVGAGPGDPGLMTARALELIARADTILYDRLIPAEALAGARSDAELLFVGKRGGGESVPQERTQQLLVERARAGREVVRLKGGDPFVFGRGGEEALALRAAGIDFDVVPGITAGMAASAYAGIPVTHRGLATGVALVTGHTQARGTSGANVHGGQSTDADGVPGASIRGAPIGQAHMGEDDEAIEPELDWDGLARFPGTLVFYMGVRSLPAIAVGLMAAGRDGAEPAALIERGTLPGQRTVAATLATLGEVAEREAIKAPAIALIGAVADLAGEIAWLPALPLAGVTVAVTRAQARASGLARRLEALGASVVQAPSIRTVPRPLDPIDPSPYDLICLTSPVAVELLFERLDDGRHPRGDARSLAGARVAAIGPGTARALADRGVVADVVPDRHVAESLVAALAPLQVRRALFARASEARDILPDGLREHGAHVDVVDLYETVAEPLPPRVREQARAADYVTFTSSSTVRFFLEALRSPTPGAETRAAAGGARARDDDAHDRASEDRTGDDDVGERAGEDRTSDDDVGDRASKDSVDATDQGQRGGGLAVDGLAPHTRVVSIGPVTSATLREHGIDPHVQAERHDIDGLVQALLDDAARHDD